MACRWVMNENKSSHPSTSYPSKVKNSDRKKLVVHSLQEHIDHAFNVVTPRKLVTKLNIAKLNIYDIIDQQDIV
jgi:hypothetical protein